MFISQEPLDYQHLEEQLKQCLYWKRLFIEQNQFWEQFTDHMTIAISFLLLGILFGMWISYRIFSKRAKIDHDMVKGIIVRVFHDDKKWFICRPRNFMEILDITLLCILDRGKDKIIDKHDKTRVRWVRIAVLLILFVLVLSGILMILSAFAWSMNPFDYIGSQD